MLVRGIECCARGWSIALSVPWQLQCVRHRVSISSFKQWKNLLIFKRYHRYRYDGHHVWSLPHLKPHEYGFRRIARKPPFFKLRKVGFPQITRRYSPINDFNRTIQIEYNWQKYGTLYHELHDALKESLPGVCINSVAKSGDATLKILTEDGRVVFDAAKDSYEDARCVVQRCYKNMLLH
ncbi:uncharacterized protein BXIN_0694 [Babesia sp. Xinjiang]|uniref:uncharacterized protein n=1 Tax=Babesia sp. Xinjiang TaxID=462227 RepID=UPI000A216143|nr:uncharacterized protein BXIN_0705 [Babesia sp. Xinjiang]XP_028872610.1 uncharacterized protein BXIN_0694 [Babesia sp. Xinjiang]ORM42123.1 hypothetical protein BXIN_0705 [Babesia sp. Xinjiang]ORM42154.1 hypothetical protein BXIN_0694 [Babesia sp. Xinjiang]